MGLAELIAEKKRKAKEALSRAPRKFMRKGEIENLENGGSRRTSQEFEATDAHTESSSRRESTGSHKADEDEDEVNLPPAQIIRRLMDRGEPIKLFGEDLAHTFKRLRKLELEAPLDVNQDRQKNDLMAAMKEVDEDNMQERSGQNAADGGPKQLQKSKYTYPEVIKLMKEDTGNGDAERDQKVLRHYWKCLLSRWEQDMNARPLEEKETPEGKRFTATFKQTCVMIKPLLTHFKKRDTPVEMVPLLVEIAQFCACREYAKANDAYVRMSIGNAAWPIGVTNVGIHSRTGREKIFSQNIAHVLNDENSRKYIQAMKRLMTYAQTKYSTDPSKSLEYKAMAGSRLYPVTGDE